MSPDLYLLAINLTRRCNLRCAHCYLDAAALAGAVRDELTTAEVCGVLDAVAARSGGTMVVLTGGEPLVREDLEAIVGHGAGRGLAMVVGTNGVLLTERRVCSLKRAGALGVGISLDSLDPVRHDRFRGLSGSWEKTLAGIEACRRHGLAFQIHFTVTEDNAGELAAMIDFARAAGARVLNVFFLVCTGRGESLSDISPRRYEQVLAEVVAAQARHTDLVIRARCAPHFKRIAHQRCPDSPLNRIGGGDGDGCIAGTHYCRITPEGGVTACPYIAAEEGNLRERPFSEIWDHGAGFARLRAPALAGKCGACEYRRLCGGCRARPLAAGGDLMDEDPFCAYAPAGGAALAPLADGETGLVRWSEAARRRLDRIPGFVRRLVKKRAEAYVAELGQDVVTTEHLAQLSARRFGADGPRMPALVRDRIEP
ncbi:MAG: radical SAM protein [Burkholderiales bacterium]|nr:radical SAM protein [Burkholderiales bacterium]